MFISAVISVLVASLTAFASPQDTSQVCPSRIYFRFNETNYDETYLGNAQAAEDIASFLNEFDPEKVERIEVLAYASPEGVYEANQRLSVLRAREFSLYARARLSKALVSKTVAIAAGEAWGPLRERILADQKLSEVNRNKILAILDDPTIGNDTRKWRLITRLSDSLYRYLLYNQVRVLRCFEIRIWFTPEALEEADGQEAQNIAAGESENAAENEDENAAVEGQNEAENDATEEASAKAEDEDELKQSETQGEVVPDDETEVSDNQEAANEVDTDVESGNEAEIEAGNEAEIQPEMEAETAWITTPLFALSSNLLYDLALAPNVAAELPIGQRWSAFLDYTNPWWVSSDNSRAWQMNKLDVGARYWLSSRDKNDPMDILSGWYLGLNLSAAYYDVEPHHKGYQGEFQSASLELGYAWKLSQRWRLRVHGAAGYMKTHYRYYIGNESDSKLIYQYHGRYTWVGPTQLGVSFQYIFTRQKERRIER